MTVSVNGDFVEFLNEDKLVPVQLEPQVSIELQESVVFASGKNNFIVEFEGEYPPRPTDEPVIFIGPDNPDTLGLMLVGDAWVNNTADNEDVPVYVLESDLTLTLVNYATKADLTAASTADRARANHTGTQLAATISDFTEAAQDAIAALLTSGTQVQLTYNDAANTLQITATGADAETMRDTIGAALVGTGNVSVVVNDAGDTVTFSITGVIPDANLPARLTQVDLDTRYFQHSEMLEEGNLPLRLRDGLSGATFTTDANLQTTNGWWKWATTCANLPASLTGGYGWGETIVYSSNTMRQRVQQINQAAGSPTVWERLSHSIQGWGPWYRVYAGETELDARYKNVGEEITETELPDRLTGVSGSPISGGDWNDATSTGWYSGNNTVNGPGSTATLMGFVLAYSSTYIRQTVFFITGQQTYQRAKINGTWTEWVQQADSQFIASKSVNDGPDTYPLGNSIFSTAEGGPDWPALYGTIFTTAVDNSRKSQWFLGGANAATQGMWFRVEMANVWSPWFKVADGTDSGWIAATMLNAWVNSGTPGYSAAQYRKIGNRVTVRGMVKSGVTVIVAFNLPVGYRPPVAMGLPIITGNQTPGRALIGSDGNVSLSTASNTDVHLEGITFLVD